jgi:polysaccharide biosynthesis protein PslH
VADALATRPDVALFQLTEAVQFRPPGDETPSVWSMEDPAVLKAEGMIRWAPAYQRPLLRARVRLLRRYEEARIERFARILLINRDDLADYRAVHPNGRFAWVPYGIDAGPGEPTARAQRPSGRIVISGNMHHPPNARAVAFFLRSVFPRVRAGLPDAHVVLVGSRPPDWMLALARDPHIAVTGFVPDVRPHLRDAMVSVCAVDLKVGTQTKVLEALAEGTPVVTTSAGNHGIGGRDGRELYVADDAETMASRVASLLRGEEWDRMSREGRRLASEFSWEKSVSRLEDVLRAVASERPRSA